MFKKKNSLEEDFDKNENDNKEEMDSRKNVLRPRIKQRFLLRSKEDPNKSKVTKRAKPKL